MADQVVLLNEGRVEQAADPRGIYSRPASPFAARFIGTPPMNLLPGSAFALGGAHADCSIGLRPEALRLDPDGPLRARVRAVEYLGADVLVDCGIGGEILQLRAEGTRDLSADGDIRLSFSLRDLHVFDGVTGERRDDLISEIGPRLRS